MDKAGQGWLAQGKLGAPAACRQRSQRGRIRPPREERLPQRPACDAHQLGHHGGECARGACSHALDPIDRTPPCVDELGPVAGEITPGALPLRREATRWPQAEAQALGEPTGSGLVGLTPRDVVDRGRVHPTHGQGVFPPVVDRLPGRARTCPGDRGHTRGRQPVSQGQQRAGHRATRLEVRAPLARLPGRIRDQPTGRTPRLMHIHARAPCTPAVQATPPATLGLAGHPALERLPGVLDFPTEAGHRAWGRQGARSSAVAGSGHPAEHDLATRPFARLVPGGLGTENGRSFCLGRGAPGEHERSVANFI